MEKTILCLPVCPLDAAIWIQDWSNPVASGPPISDRLSRRFNMSRFPCLQARKQALLPFWLSLQIAVELASSSNFKTPTFSCLQASWIGVSRFLFSAETMSGHNLTISDTISVQPYLEARCNGVLKESAVIWWRISPFSLTRLKNVVMSLICDG